MPAAVESVGSVEGRVKASLQSVRAPRWGLLPPVGRHPVKKVGDSEGQSKSLLAESAPTGTYGPYQASGWATLAKKQKKCQVGLEDNTAGYGQEKLWVNMAICLVSPVLYFDLRPGQYAIPKLCTGRPVTERNRVGGIWLMKWDKKKKSHGTLIDWCIGREWPVKCMTVISAWWRLNMPFQGLSGRWTII